MSKESICRGKHEKESGKLKEDNRNYVVGFTDDFSYADEAKVILDIEVIENEET